MVTVPPLLPEARIREIVWYDKAERIPLTIRMRDGCEARFRSGEQDAATAFQGQRIHVIFPDEELGPNAELFWREFNARIMDFDGRIIVTACPTSDRPHVNDIIRNAHRVWRNDRWEEGNGVENRTEVVFLLTEKNASLPEKAVADFRREMLRSGGEAELLARMFGIPKSEEAMGLVHFQETRNIRNLPCPLAECTLYEAIDPGKHTCAVAFLAAAKPDDEGRDRTWVYHEIYEHNISPEELSAKILAARREFAADSDPLVTYMDPYGDRTSQVGPVTLARRLQEVSKGRINARPGRACARLDGLRELDAMLESGRLFIAPECTHWIHEATHFIKKRDRSTGELLDEFKGPDHLLDPTRIAIVSGVPYRPQFTPAETVVNWLPEKARRMAAAVPGLDVFREDPHAALSRKGVW